MYSLYAKNMFNVVMRLVPQREDAEDILQDAFIKAFTHIKKFDGSRTFGVWLKKIVLNTAISALKKRKLSFVEWDENTDAESAEVDSIPGLEPGQLHEAVKRLPEGARVVFTLHLLEGYKHQEVAEILDISLSTSKSQYIRAKKMLKEELQNTYYNG